MTLAGGAVVSLLLHQPTFLILSSIGALGTLATALWPRLRRRARRRADGERARAALVGRRRRSRVPSSGCRGGLRADALELPAPGVCPARGRSSGHAGPTTRVRSPLSGPGDRWQPPGLTTGGDAVPDEWWALDDSAGALHDVPVAVDLGPGAVVGVVGPPAVARPLARSLVLQLAVAHGPADLLAAAVTVAGSPERVWLRWLPHARDPTSGDRLVATGDDLPESLLVRVSPVDGAGRTWCSSWTIRP